MCRRTGPSADNAQCIECRPWRGPGGWRYLFRNCRVHCWREGPVTHGKGARISPQGMVFWSRARRRTVCAQGAGRTLQRAVRCLVTTRLRDAPPWTVGHDDGAHVCTWTPCQCHTWPRCGCAEISASSQTFPGARGWFVVLVWGEISVLQ